MTAFRARGDDFLSRCLACTEFLEFQRCFIKHLIVKWLCFYCRFFDKQFIPFCGHLTVFFLSSDCFLLVISVVFVRHLNCFCASFQLFYPMKAQFSQFHSASLSWETVFSSFMLGKFSLDGKCAMTSFCQFIFSLGVLFHKYKKSRGKRLRAFLCLLMIIDALQFLTSPIYNKE